MSIERPETNALAMSSSFSKSPAPSVNGSITSSLRSSVMREPSYSKGVQRTRSTRLSNGSATAPIRRPKTPHTLYPMQYGRKMRDMEIWDNTIFYCASGRRTLSTPEHIPPGAVILDIGCGYGSWAIMTAQDHPDYQVVGLDVANIQPDLRRLGLDELAERVTWVHGDMLQGLPFPNGHFDLVRTLFIEFCIPETKWAKLFEEIERVLKPGGIFETSQEALIFPCPRYPPRIVPLKDPQTSKTHRRSSTQAKARASAEIADADHRDHSKLKVAFDAMLEVRFLNPNIISTLPFYMNSHFDNVHMTPTLRIMLPPSSFVRSRGESPSGDAAEPQLMVDQRVSISDMLRMEKYAASSELTIGHGGQMHLNQTMNIILACEEAIWEQFEALNPLLDREDFDHLMKNWEMDMRDRIDMRGTLQAGLGWDVPMGTEDPDRKAWREKTLKLHETETMWDAQPIPEPCRCIRAFTGTKPRSES